jgi:hypothetical protein
MGCFVFERNGSTDMFGFFRDDGGPRINADYWAEKRVPFRAFFSFD